MNLKLNINIKKTFLKALKNIQEFVGKNWFKITIIIGIFIIFYLFYPKYYFIKQSNDRIIKCNKITGECNSEYGGTRRFRRIRR